VNAVAARVALRPAPPGKCNQKLDRGEVRRCPQNMSDKAGKPIGYHLTCAACPAKAMFTERECGFVEEPVLPGKDHPKRLVGIERPPRCYGCGRRIGIDGTDLIAIEPEAAAGVA
jgi:hypothetical protein